MPVDWLDEIKARRAPADIDRLIAEVERLRKERNTFFLLSPDKTPCMAKSPSSELRCGLAGGHRDNHIAYVDFKPTQWWEDSPNA